LKSPTPPKLSCAVITVTYNSQKHIDKWLECLDSQLLAPKQIIIVDTGSKDRSYLGKLQQQNIHTILAPPESGFCVGNNIAWQHVDDDIEYVLFLNPDAFLSPTFLEQAVAIMNMPHNSSYGALTGTLWGYDIDTMSPTGFYDSRGIFATPWGHWYDRDQGLPLSSAAANESESIPAICGACFFARKSALTAVLLPDGEVFDSSFYMYKEDIDLSLRLRTCGWKLLFEPQLVAYHCRGWQPDRQKMPKKLRLCSARNELKIHTRARRPLPMLYSATKYLAVKFLNF
jgi:N-acetylglucosaminyl-diphospho-decaprenol L-rhamnosyltransferase